MLILCVFINGRIKVKEEVVGIYGQGLNCESFMRSFRCCFYFQHDCYSTESCLTLQALNQLEDKTLIIYKLACLRASISDFALSWEQTQHLSRTASQDFSSQTRSSEKLILDFGVLFRARAKNLLVETEW